MNLKNLFRKPQPNRSRSAKAGPSYRIVDLPDTMNRPGGQVETKPEDQILQPYQRGRMLDLARNAARNSTTFNSVLRQLDLNIVGPQGGKAMFQFKDEEAAKYVKREFARWTRNADFFDGMSLNQVLRLVLKTELTNGDCVLLFDDGLIEDSGKLVIYEGDEIHSTTDEAVKKRYGAGARQSNGRIYNANGRFIGAVVSRSQRGADVFDPAKSYFLKRDPDAGDFDSLWMMPRNVFRPAQGRGVSQLASGLATILDLEDLCTYELQSAKKNSQTLMQVLQEREDAEVEAPSAFDGDPDSMTDEQIEAAADAEAEQKTMTLDRITGTGAVYQVLPPGFKAEILDATHPNPNVIDFINWLAGRSAAPFGLPEQYATLAANGSDFKSQQIMASAQFADSQKYLEKLLDWIVWRWATWAVRKGRLDGSVFYEGWVYDVSWQWPRPNELDEQGFQNAVSMKLRNMTGSYREYYGADWREKLEQVRAEIDWCKQHGLPHPSYEMISGGERTGAEIYEGETE